MLQCLETLISYFFGSWKDEKAVRFFSKIAEIFSTLPKKAQLARQLKTQITFRMFHQEAKICTKYMKFIYLVQIFASCKWSPKTYFD